MAGIRSVREEEREEIARIYANAYRRSLEEMRGWAADCELQNTRAIFEGTRIVSMLQILPFMQWIGGRLLPMGGIGGVATWADRQGRGYAGLLMKDSLLRMHERGETVSLLYPFSFVYYRQFGWEMCGRKVSYERFTQRDVLPQPERRLVRACVTTKDIPALNQAYEEFAPRYNLCIQRTQRMWQRKWDFFAKNYGQFYIIEDGKKPIGWFGCVNKASEGGCESITHECVVLCRTALKAMMGFLATLPTNVTAITVTVPQNIELWRLFREPFIQMRLKPVGQFRVVDVRNALLKRGYAESLSGTVSIQIEDPAARWNNATWHLVLTEGAPTVKRTRTEPDVSCAVTTFSEMFCGATHPGALAEAGLIAVRTPQKIPFLADCFFDKPVQTLDWF
jgi:predicted acetyltransferase